MFRPLPVLTPRYADWYSGELLRTEAMIGNTELFEMFCTVCAGVLRARRRILGEVGIGEAGMGVKTSVLDARGS